MNKILSKCLQGQKWAWDAFVEEYAPVIFAAVQRILRSHGLSGQEQTVEDISQDVFLRLINNDFHLLRSYDPARASLATWLTIVTRSTTIDFLRRRRLVTTSLDQAPPLASAESPSAPSPATEGLPAGLLTARQKLILHLLFDRQLAPADIAKLLGISPQVVRSTKHKAIERLQRHFKGTDFP